MNIQYQDQTITIFESALCRTTSTVIHTNDCILVVDPNWLPNEVNAIRLYVDRIKKDKPVYLLFTHSDFDHIIGYKAFSGTKVIVSKAFENNPNKNIVLKEIKKFDDEYYIKRRYPIAYPKGDIIVSNDDEKLQIGNTEFIFYQAKGHNADGLFTLVQPYGILIVGDYLSNIEFPYIYYSVQEYLNTLDKVKQIIQKYKIKILIPGHGDYTKDIKEMLKREKDSRKYIVDLMNTIYSKEKFDIDQLFHQYNFPIVMHKFHKANIKVLSK